MKRCPQCEFIYEDDQSLCDMDGVLLVFDSRTLPNLHALATVSAPLPGRTQRRNRMVPAFATLLLMLAVGSIYYVSTLRNSAQNEFSPASVSSTTTEAPAPEPTPEPNQAQVPAADATEEQRLAPEATDARNTKAAPGSTSARPAVTTAPKPATKSSATGKPEAKKDDSKVGSILKKTGKILKKPFKF